MRSPGPRSSASLPTLLEEKKYPAHGRRPRHQAQNLSEVSGWPDLFDTALFRKGTVLSPNYVLSADDLVSTFDAQVVGIGAPSTTYPTYCVRGPLL